LAENGVSVGKNVNYAKRQESRNEFWLNPKIYALEKDWDIVLNNQYRNEIIVFRVSANTFKMESKDSQGLIARPDKPDRIDMNIIEDTMIDRRSKYDFTPFIIKRIKY